MMRLVEISGQNNLTSKFTLLNLKIIKTNDEMPGRGFFTIIRPGHYPDKLPPRIKSRPCITNPSQPTLLKTASSQLQRQLRHGGMSSSSKTCQRKSRFCVKVKKGGHHRIADEPGLCGKCHLKFERIRTHLRKCHPRLYRRVILALRDAGPITGVNLSSTGDVKEPSTNEQSAQTINR